MQTGFSKFVLCRDGEIGLLAGRNTIAEGIIFSSGKVALASMKPDQSVSVYDSLKQMAEANCSDGKTRVVWDALDLTH